MSDKPRTGRTIIHYPFRDWGRLYNSVILSLEHTGRFCLPGGQYKPGTDSSTLDTVVREVKEELGLDVVRKSGLLVYRFDGHSYSHDVYLVEASGTVRLDSELEGIGLFNCGRGRQIPEEKLERHVKALKTQYFGTPYQRKPTRTRITIPSKCLKSWEDIIRRLR